MKRRDLIRHIEKQGCEFLREGGIFSLFQRRCGDKNGLNILLLVMLIPFNFHSMRSYNIYMENQAAFFHVLNQMQTIGGNVFHLLTMLA